MNAKERLETLTRENRRLTEALEVYDLNYCWLADLVIDAGDSLKRGEPIDQDVLDAFRRYEWKEDGRQLELADCHRITRFAANTRHADAPPTCPVCRSLVTRVKRREPPQPVDAVDPPAGTRERRPRAYSNKRPNSSNRT